MEIEKIISSILDKQATVYIGSVDEEGYPNTKAMLTPRKREGIKTFYFHTNTHSMRVQQYRNNSKANLYICDEFHFQGIMLIGNIEVLEDKEHKEMLWQSGDTMYYSLGVTDPDYCVLKFTAIKGRYYSNFNSESFTVK